MGKLLGCMLLCLGSGILCVQRITARRQELYLLRGLAAALESIEMLIRWQKLPLSRAIGLQEDRPLCGDRFAEIRRKVESGTALHSAWTDTFNKISLAEVADILCRIEWNGDEEQLTGNLHYAAQQLRDIALNKGSHQAQTEKLYIALSASAVGLLVIILL